MKNSQKLISQTLEFIAKNSNEEQSIKFLKNTAKYIAALFNISYVFINKYSLKKPKVVESVVFLGKEGLLPNKTYKLANTPCENVVNSKICVYSNNLQTLFSKDIALKKMDAQSYVGVPLWSSSGEPIGLITIIDDKPISDTKSLEINLQIIAIKVAQVLEKILLKNKLELKIKDLEKSNIKLKKSEQILEEAQQISKLGHWEYNIKTNQSTWSDEIYRILNLKPQELEASEELFMERVHPNDRVKVKDLYSNAIKTTKENIVDFKLLFESGKEKFIQEKWKVIFNSKGEPVKALGTILDITKLKEAEERYKSLSEASFEAVFLSENGFGIEQNSAAQKMFGYSSDEINGMKATTLIAKEDHELVLTNIKMSNETSYEVTALRKDGSMFPAAIKSRMTLYKGKKVRITAFNDLTVQKKLETEAKKLTTAVEQSANTIVITDTQGVIEYVNPKFTETSGYTAEEVIGKTPRILKSGNQPKDYYQKMWKTISSGQSWSGEFQNKAKNGIVFWEQATITPIKNNRGKITNYLAVKEDITKRKIVEENLKNAFNLLKENEDYLTTILKTTNEGFWAVDANNITTEVNPEMCKILGREESDILGASVFEFVDSENAKIFKSQHLKRAKGLTSKYEIELKHSNGKNIPCLLKSTPTFNRKNEIIGTFAMVSDISSIKEAYELTENQNQELTKLSFELSEKNRLLLDSSYRFKNLFEQSPVSIWEQDYSKVIELLKQKKIELADIENYINQNPDFIEECVSKINIINVNKVTRELFGVKNVAELKLHLRKTDNKIAIKALKYELLSIALGKTEFNYITELVDKNGGVIKAIVNLSFIDNYGKAIASVIDITALKYAENQLKESEQKFRELYEKSGDAILILKDGIFIDCNNSTLSLLEYTSKQSFLNQHPSKISPKLQPEGQESLEKSEQMMNLALKNGTHRFEWIHLKSNGDEIPVEVLLTAITNEPTNKIIHCVWRDITKRKKVLKDLTIAKEQAEESDRLKTEFLNNMSHEIRTPMNGILGFSEMLNDPDIDMHKRSNFVNIIQNSGHQLLHVIDDILEISKLGTKQVKVIDEEVCLNDILLELFSIFDVKAKENKTPLYLNKTLSDNESIILTDKTKLNKIISNLLENALKFTNKGFIEFGYNIKNTSKVTQLQIYVKDTGIGIKPEKHQLIFERFQQAEKELIKNVGGLGLGLSIAKENTELLGGKISIESEIMKGATFFVTIPFKPIHKIIETEENCNKYTILIAEDEEVNYMYLETILKDSMKLNCTILHAKDGKEAIRICKNNAAIDIILMDLKMPILNGFLATKQIRKFNTQIPIIAQTAYSTIEDREEALAIGCNDFISKPIEKEILINIIDKFLIKEIY